MGRVPPSSGSRVGLGCARRRGRLGARARIRPSCDALVRAGSAGSSTRRRRTVFESPISQRSFPSATFVFVRRRAADNVSSLMEAWRARPRFVRYRLPGAADRPRRPERRSLELRAPAAAGASSATLRSRRSAHEQYVACNDRRARGARIGRPVALGRRSLREPRRHAGRRAPPRLFPARALVTAPEPLNAAALAETPAPTTLTAPRPQKWRERERGRRSPGSRRTRRAAEAGSGTTAEPYERT